MNAVYAAMICVAGAVVCMLLRPQRPELATGAAIAAGTAALLVCLPEIKSAASAIYALSGGSGMGREYASILMRACGVALIAEFAEQICTDAGESALAGRIRIAARLALAVMALPLLTDVLSQCSLLYS